ncbi:hypothetical protein CAOG_03664 [Capsaspora owczarzaki ATCC 30864]|uniref:hypothetical protein n=1 Tax=Capsaspora owczarzaki (strain ATCC 30864) TaxID=595528 RepID=UPI00035266F3|nr:hypothetical protein CAOG_03664 [Capsaspora owczarzaki ATCC 30864]|eukprot:XP_004363392.2 hypothetical protein CAOG_03664 [Capsaspora owczarzaki ATCC 30864]
MAILFFFFFFFFCFCPFETVCPLLFSLPRSFLAMSDDPVVQTLASELRTGLVIADSAPPAAHQQDALAKQFAELDADISKLDAEITQLDANIMQLQADAVALQNDMAVAEPSTEQRENMSVALDAKGFPSISELAKFVWGNALVELFTTELNTKIKQLAAEKAARLEKKQRLALEKQTEGQHEFPTSLPPFPLIQHTGPSTSVSKTHEKAKYRPPQDFGIIDGLTVQLRRAKSISSENGLASFVALVLDSLAFTLNLNILAEVNTTMFGQSPDVLLPTHCDRPLVIVEVKMPGSSVMADEYNAGQTYDCIHRCHLHYGVGPLFGILTTYEEWRFVWCEDDFTTRCASATTRAEIEIDEHDKQPARRERAINDRFGELRSTRTALGPDAPPATLCNPHQSSFDVKSKPEPDRFLCTTRVLKLQGDGPLLINILRSVIYKAWHWTIFQPSLDGACSGLRLTEASVSRQDSDDKTKSPAYQYFYEQKAMPALDLNKWRYTPARGAEATSLDCFVNLGQGRDGDAWLASVATEARPGVCVVKLRHPKATAETLCKEEQQRWHAIWGNRDWPVELNTLFKDVRVIEYHTWAVIMPYISPATEADQSKPEVQDAVRAAVQHMANCGFEHNDLHWRHVGLFT